MLAFCGLWNVDPVAIWLFVGVVGFFVVAILGAGFGMMAYLFSEIIRNVGEIASPKPDQPRMKSFRLPPE